MRSKLLTVICLMLWAARGVAADSSVAIPVADFLNSTGACVHIQHHQNASKLIEPIKYTGIRNVRDGADTNFDMTGLLLLHKQAGVLSQAPE
jgi:hypothetical protein